MNLNKYHGSGRLYTKYEAAQRAADLHTHNYAYAGYVGGVDGKTGLPRVEAKVAPHEVGNNHDKRMRRAARGVRK
jgi:hypothetical protein